MQLFSLYLFHLIYYPCNGLISFVSKLYAELGMTNGQIGVLNSLPILFALVASPFIGVLTDRVPSKRLMLSALLLLLALTSFLAGACTTFAPLFLAVSLFSVFSQNIIPLNTTISLEYTRSIGANYGPIRLVGTVGYQIGALLVAIFLSASLKGLYPLIGVVCLLSVGVTLIMPNVRGAQHDSGKKVPLSKLFEDKALCSMYLMIFLATLTTQFYIAFFSKHLGDLNMSNRMVSAITLLSVVMELPFLAFADRLAKKATVWTWLLVGMLCNAVRFLGLAFTANPIVILLFQIPGFTVMGCFEYYPALYINRRVHAEQVGAAQSVLNLTTFGVARILGSLAGGKLSEFVGIPAIFAGSGVWLIALTAVCLPFALKRKREDAGAAWDFTAGR